mmetsp:Transcript_19117/g.56842  ORF Transcript_19117/g.56842 Transcript_19117/m.56842 type:complete len:82 (+) Transcript_19117:172-417(+)
MHALQGCAAEGSGGSPRGGPALEESAAPGPMYSKASGPTQRARAATVISDKAVRFALPALLPCLNRRAVPNALMLAPGSCR